MKMTMRSASMLAVAVLVSVTVTLSLARGSSRFGLGSANAQTVGETYRLSGLQIQYPFRAPSGLESTRAGVSYIASWSGTDFPGTAGCTITLRDSTGGIVGETSFPMFSVGGTGRAAFFPVDVSGTPATVDGSCDAAVYPPGPGYTFDNLRIGPHSLGNEGYATVTFTAHWATSVDPSVRMCNLSVVLDDGQTFNAPFTLSTPDGADLQQGVPAPAERIEDATITCRELTAGEG